MRPIDIKVRSPNAPHLEETFSYALTGCNRVDHLVGIYREARQRSGKIRGRVWTHLSDVLRAAVVLCHANLEQVLRDLLVVEAEWTPEFLQRIPLPGSKHIRADRFSFADLSTFASLPVSELLFDAVWDYLGKRSFTQVADVAEALDMCKLDLVKYRKFFPEFQALMERRHHIAHTADLEESPGRGKQMARSISAETVSHWNKNVFEFVLELTAEMSRRT